MTPVLVYVLCAAFGTIPAAARQTQMPSQRAPSCGECDAVIHRVLSLLPRKPVKVVVLDTDDTTQLLHDRLADVEGFVTAGDPAVYLRKQTSDFQHALKRRGIWDYVLAITIWHEMAHLEGADERHARQKEEELWEQFVRAGRVDARRGFAYLTLLRSRPQE